MIKSIVLFLLAFVLAVILFPLGIIYSFFKIVFILRDNAFMRSAIAIDQIANTVMEDLFNDLLITRGGYRFGDVRETVSSALGKNKVRGTLSFWGILLDELLDFFDPNHSIKSIKEL